MECRFQTFKFGLTNYCVILTVLFIQSSCSVTDPCPENVSYSTVVNMCQSESVDGKNSVVIRANTADNCLCSIEVMNQSTSESITTYIKRLRSPFDINGSCGIEITMEKHNNGNETGNAGTITCLTSYERSLKGKLRQNERIMVNSKVINGQNTNGYCILFAKGHDSGTIRASCNYRKSTTVLPEDRSSKRLPSTKSTEITTKGPVTRRSNTSIQAPKEITSKGSVTQCSNTCILAPKDPKVLLISVGISSSVLCVSLIINIVVLCGRRCSKSHVQMQQESRNEQNLPDNRNDGSDYHFHYYDLQVPSDHHQYDTTGIPSAIIDENAI